MSKITTILLSVCIAQSIYAQSESSYYSSSKCSMEVWKEGSFLSFDVEAKKSKSAQNSYAQFKNNMNLEKFLFLS